MKECFLSSNGYGIPKKNLSKEQYNFIKTELTLVPFNFTQPDPKQIKYEVYQEIDGIVYVPRYYGIELFGLPKKTTFEENKVKIKFVGKLRDYQEIIVEKCLDHIKTKGGGLLVVPCGCGKCLAKGTKILMYDGYIKQVENLILHDLIMGDDSTPRRILSLTNGRDEMYDVINTLTDEKYSVNQEHILSLIVSSKQLEFHGKIYFHNDVVDIPIKEYLDFSLKHHLKGYHSQINFQEKKTLSNPYYYGLHIGTYERQIAYEYKCNSIMVRLNVLAGIIDAHSDFETSYYEIEYRNKKFIKDVMYVARSLGFICKIQKYYPRNRLVISGNIKLIPVILNTKQIINETIISTYPIKIVSIGIGEYYGFEINENGRFVLEDFSVTHNTTMALNIASKLNVKTLVITHKTFLQDQWISRCKQFTKSDIGIIRQSKVDVENKDFVIAMIQSLCKRKYDPQIFKQFGFIIADECHHFSSKHFSKALAKTGAKYTLGLSATPYRNDGLFKAVSWYLGDIIYQKKIQTNNQVIVKIITFISKDPLFVEKRRYIQGEIRPDCVKMLSNLIQIKSRNDHIINIVNELRKDANRKILLLSGRKAHLDLLKKRIDEKIKDDVDNGNILENECKTYFYTGDVKQNDRFEAEQYGDILFATYDMAHEGLDIERLNTIILATPKKDVVQAVGRILRRIFITGDTRPIVIDISDNISIFSSQSKKRRNFYNQSKYIQNEYYVYDDNFISPHKYGKLLGVKNENKNVPKDYTEILDIPLVEIVADNNTNDFEEDIIQKKNSNSILHHRGKQQKKYNNSTQLSVDMFRRKK